MKTTEMKVPEFKTLCDKDGKVIAKGGWVNATKFEMQASAAEMVGKRLAMRPIAVYEVACKADVYLPSILHILIPHDKGIVQLTQTADALFQCAFEETPQPLLDLLGDDFKKLSEK
jgi:hypothetical protein